MIVHDLLHERFHLGVAEFRLRLAFKLRFHKFYRHDRGEAFAHIFTREICVLFFQYAPLARELVHQTGQRGPETFFVCSTLGGVDGVREGVDRLSERRVPLQRDLGA